MVPYLPYMEQVLYGPPHVQSDGPPLPYLIWNRYVCPQHVPYDFFRPASEESTACPNKYIPISNTASAS